MKNQRDVLADWTERDLSTAAERGQLPLVFGRDEDVARVEDLLGSGRHPIVVGEPGVGKTAIVQEIARRASAGKLPALAGKRIVQISIRSRASALSKPDEEIGPEFQKLVRELTARSDSIVPFFRDIDAAYKFDLEAQLVQLALRFDGAILAEGDSSRTRAMMESEADLDQHFFLLSLAEPTVTEMELILRLWAADRSRTGVQFSDGALAVALELSHRFLARTRFPRKVIEVLQQAAATAGEAGVITDRDIIRRFQEAYRIPALLVDPEVTFDPAETTRLFKAQVLEQDEAVEATVRMMSLIKSGLSDPRRPFGSFLFVGPTGVGKTHIAQLLAEHFFGSRERILRINMADYPAPEDAFTLFGNPNGYQLALRRGQLTLKLQGYPFAVLLFDEFEKAHFALHDRFLQLVDEGAFINGAGETISCRSLIVIATSNAGAEVYRSQPFGFANASSADVLDRELDRRLLQHFRLEFLNRFDQVVHFHPLTRAGIRAIALREVQALCQRSGVRSRRISVEVDESVLDWLTANGYDPHYGARFLRRTIERHLATALAEVLVRPDMDEATVELTVRGGQVTARVLPTKAETKPSARTKAVAVPEGKTRRVRRMNRDALHQQADATLAAAGHLLELLERHREASSELVRMMGGEGFWDDPPAAQDVLSRFRELDVTVQAETRLAGGIAALERIVAEEHASTERLAAAVEAAMAAVHDWETRIAEGGSASRTMLIYAVDPLKDSSAWIEQIGAIEAAWARRLHLECSVAGVGFSDGVVTRLVLDIEGPGAAAFFEMEEGIHRLHQPEASDLRAGVVFLGEAADRAIADPLPIRQRHGPLQSALTQAIRVEQPATGVSFELQGGDAARLKAVARQLVEGTDETRTREVARTYGMGGAGAHDPRTGAVIPRLKDALDGRLEPMLEAWRLKKRQTVE